MPAPSISRPAARHMTVARRDGVAVIALDDGPPVNFCKPAVDPLFSSAAEVWGRKVLGLVLTGMGSDGLRGAQAIVAAGGSVMAQDEATSVVWGMPGQVAHAGVCSARAAADRDRAAADAPVRGRTRMTPQDFDYLRKLLKRALRPGAVGREAISRRKPPAAGRAQARARRPHRTGRRSSRLPMAAPLTVEVVEAMTTNETFFFRDKMPFEHFRETIMPALLAARAREKRIRIWCTACSTGQEPYSLAMSLKGMGRRSPAGASKSSPPISPTRCWRRPRPASTASSRCSAACRSSCW